MSAPTLDDTTTTQRVRRPPPVVWWAAFGAIVVAFNIFVWGRWVSGPLFEHVAQGPSDPPTWMKVTLLTWQVVGIPVVLWMFWRLLVRPWRRDGRPSTDGLLCAAFFLMCFQEPLWSYFGHWFTYNAYLVNYGSWLGSVPGVRSFAKPGAMLLYPILWIGPVYPVVFLVSCWLGSLALRWGRSHVPNWGTARIFAVIVFPALVIYDIVLEGIIFMPVGFYTYPGGIGPSLFPDSYHKFPLHIAVAGGVLFSGMTALRSLKNDRGETFVERGVSSMRISPGRQAALRFFALAGAVQLIFFVTAGAPHLFVGAHSASWPADHQTRSYFTDGICGAGTPRACPGREGKPPLPFSDGKGAPFSGKLLGTTTSP